jgi:hypothetical protein
MAYFKTTDQAPQLRAQNSPKTHREEEMPIAEMAIEA